MKTHHTLLAIGSSFLALALPVVAQAPKVVWELSKGIKAPESAYFARAFFAIRIFAHFLFQLQLPRNYGYANARCRTER